MFEGFQGSLIEHSRCQETPVSRTDVRLVVAVIPDCQSVATGQDSQLGWVGWYPDKIPLNAVEREPVPTRVLPNASKARDFIWEPGRVYLFHMFYCIKYFTTKKVWNEM